MKRILLLLCATLFWVPLAAAQITTVTGTVKDSNGVAYAGASLKAQLVLAGGGATGQATVTNNSQAQCISAGAGNAPCQIPFPGTNGPVTLDPTGSFTLNLQDNSQVTPASTKWLFTVNTPGSPPPLGTGPQTCSVTLTITGASQSVSSSFSACPALSSAGVGGGGTTPGVFTNAMNEPFLFSTQGTGSCNTNTILNFGGSTANNTDGLAVCLTMPASGISNSLTNGMAVYLQNTNTQTTGCQFGGCDGVGYYVQSWANGNNSKNWGANLGVVDTAGKTGQQLIGDEIDVTVANNSTVGFGELFSFRGNGQPTGDNFPVIAVQAPQGTGTFTAGFECQPGSISAASTYAEGCVIFDKQLAGGVAANSSIAYFRSNDGTVDVLDSIGTRKNHLFSTVGGFANFSATNVPAGYAIDMKATATLGVSTLVKLDTANTDSVVICTTADTSCDGVVAEVVAAGDCNAGSTVCPIIMGSGNKGVGVLGTGTCAVGNFVIVDTTTNGRVKCQAGIPAQGAYIGKAMSAQNTVGLPVDFVTHFQ